MLLIYRKTAHAYNHVIVQVFLTGSNVLHMVFLNYHVFKLLLYNNAF